MIHAVDAGKKYCSDKKILILLTNARVLEHRRIFFDVGYGVNNIMLLWTLHDFVALLKMLMQ